MFILLGYRLIVILVFLFFFFLRYKTETRLSQVEVKPNTLREKRAARQKKDRLQSGVRAGPPPPGMMGMGGPGYMPP